MIGRRIGVFICQCGSNIGRVIDVPRLAEELKGLDGIGWVEHGRYLCSDEGLAAIRDGIKKFNLDRVVVGACTPRNLEKQFAFVCQEAGLNPYLLEMVNLREHCSWVHLNDKEGAYKKAKELLIMGCAKSKFLEPQYVSSIDVSSTLLVVGGGISGITAALSAARQGHKVILIEKEPELGGLLRDLDTLWPTNMSAAELVAALKGSVENENNIEVLTSTIIDSIEGGVGRFKVNLRTAGPSGEAGTISEHTAGAIILATGAVESKPKGHYLYGEDERVMTEMELERKLKDGGLKEPKEAVFIQCVGARGEDVPYCSKICCYSAIKNALRLKELYPDCKISILHRDIFVAGLLGEELFNKAWNTGIQFHYYSLIEKPEVNIEGGNLLLRGVFGNSREEISIKPDILVLSTPLKPYDSSVDLAKKMKIPTDSDRFFMEKNPKIYPMDSQRKGIYLCGSCHEPAIISKCIAQSQGAASRASIQLGKEYITLHPMASVNAETCRACGRCVDVCPNDALEMVEDEHGRHVKVSDILCQGCGTCCAECWTHSIHMNYFHSKHIHAMIDSLVELLQEGGLIDV